MTKNTTDFRHDSPECLGVLVTNLGTPDSPSPADVRRYLKEFLWDRRVVEIPRIIWWFVLNLIILNTRPKRSAAAYAKVWTEEGSPLLVISKKQAQALQASLEGKITSPVRVELAMRYGTPSIAQGLERLRQAGARRIVILPLYPQYSASTTASTFDAVTSEIQGWRWIPELRFINHYHDERTYIAALAASIRSHWEQHGQAEKLVMSFHGIPREYFLSGDPYFCECHKTARLLAEELELNAEQWQLTFQSRLGPKEWLTPYTDQTLKALAREGVKKVQVVCPGFSADCLETLEEIAMENKEVFIQAGGEHYGYIPCLNDDPGHIDMMSELLLRHTQSWSTQVNQEDLDQRKALAVEAGAKE